MTRIISILNYKGGTGKTTTTVNLGAGLALRGARVLCIDMDPQGSLGTWLGIRHTRGVADMMLGYAAPEQCIVPARDNLDLILGSHTLVQAEAQLWKFPDERVSRRVLYHTMKHINGYDYILLDCSHSISMLTHNALLYANELIIPVSTDYLAMVGIRQVIDTLKTIGRIPDHHLQLTVVLPTMYYGRLRKDRDVLQLLERYFRGKVADPIRANVKLAEASGHQQSIYEYAPNSPGAVDYALLVERVMSDV
ncbi:MAG TPA: ParA family protein [Anaerolineae bacterium]|nr:ParA family protein [Anaerolineae bacterium]HQI85566.1 ParA family protein [Anaerolineae bacterium]